MRQRPLYMCKRALHVRKRALCYASSNYRPRDLVRHQAKVHCRTKCPVHAQKSPTHSQKSPTRVQKSPTSHQNTGRDFCCVMKLGSAAAKRTLQMHKRALYIRKRAQCMRKRALYIYIYRSGDLVRHEAGIHRSKRALCVAQRALHIRKRALHFIGIQDARTGASEARELVRHHERSVGASSREVWCVITRDLVRHQSEVHRRKRAL